ncbi:hypothetical protein [Bradyrhizobium liaoningense]
MTANPIELIGGLTTNANVLKADIVSWGKSRVAQVLADAAELRSTTLAGQNAVQIRVLKQAYYLDAADTTTADDGLSCIISADGYRFKPAKLLPTGDVVGTTDTQTLTNKTIDGDLNTVVDISNASLKPVGAATLKGNSTAASGAVGDFTIQSLTALSSPHGTLDFFLAYDHVSGTFRKVAPNSLAPSTMVDTIAALKAIDKTSRTLVQVNGYYAIGDCRPRAYYYDSTDTTSSDNAGSIIVATDGGRWKLIGERIWTMKMFGAKEDGTDQSAVMLNAITVAAAANVPLEWDGTFSVNGITVTGLSGMHWIGRGGVVGIATTATDAIIHIVNVTDLSIDGRLVVDGNNNTNYTYGLHGDTTGAGTLQFINLFNIIYQDCPIAWAFGNTSLPDATVSEINIFGGRTVGCPGVGIGIGKNTVVSTHGCTWFSDYGSGGSPWTSLPIVGVEAKGSTININGGELLRTANTTGVLLQASGLVSGTGHVYGNISVKGAVIEAANILAATTVGGATSPTGGAIQISGGNRMVLTADVTGGAIQTDAGFIGEVTVVGNSGFSPPSVVRTQWNVNAGNAACKVTVDMPSFGANCLQGYAGLNSGVQSVIGGDIASATERVVTGTTATQAANDSYIVFATSGACTVTMLDPARFPGRKVTFRNAAAQAINSASSNINSIGGSPGTSILPATVGKFVTLRASGSFWQVEAAN